MQIQSGRVLIYHLYDMADAVNLERLRKQWVGQADSIHLISRRASPTYLQFDRAPVLLPLGRRSLEVNGTLFEAELSAKVFAFGVVSVCWQLELAAWESVEHAEHYVNNSLLATQSQQVIEDLMPALRPVLEEPYEHMLTEDYTVFYVKNTHPVLTAEELLLAQGETLARLVRGESKTLSPQARDNALKQSVSYFEDDLVVMSWNAAFIYDPEGSQEHVDMIEFANAKLLELRSYDQLLAAQLADIYAELEMIHKKRWRRLFRNPFQSTLQKSLGLLIEVSELNDRMENSLKIVGDLYCARIYRVMSEVLHIPDWQHRVDRKLHHVQQVYETLSAEVQEHRSTLLEIIIVLLILVEVVLYFFPNGGH